MPNEIEKYCSEKAKPIAATSWVSPSQAIQNRFAASTRNKNVIPSGNEDAYFCTFDLKYIEAKSENHINFSMETIYSENPVGVHQIYRYIDDIMNDDEKNNFLRKINEKLLY